MDLRLSDEQALVRDLVRNYAQKEIKAKADELDKTGRFPAETIAELTEMGIMGLTIPEVYGGSGMDEVTKAVAIEEVARCCSSTAEILAVHILASEIIVRNCNEQQKQKYLAKAAAGQLAAFALTEPGAGSDAGGLRTKAVKDGDFYVLNGSKCFISNMGPEEGDFAIVIALTDPEKGSRGMSAFIVDRDTPGFSLGKLENKMGMNAAAVSEIILDNCRVPAENLIGKEGDGFKIAMSGLDGGRIGISAQSLGIAEAALEEAITYAKQREQFGKPIAAKQGLQWYISEMATRVEAARGLVMKAAFARSVGDPQTSMYASMAKYFASETAKFVCDKSLQIHGGYGYMKDYPIERLYRDARILCIYEGTSEVQKIVIAKHALQ